MAINVIDGTQALSGNGTQSYGGIQIRYIPNPEKKTAESISTQNEGLISNFFDTSSPYPATQYGLTGRSTNSYVYFNMASNVTTVDESKAWFEANHTQILYKLAEPIIVQLDPTTVTALTGHNTIWCNTGDVISVDYNII